MALYYMVIPEPVETGKMPFILYLYSLTMKNWGRSEADLS